MLRRTLKKTKTKTVLYVNTVEPEIEFNCVISAGSNNHRNKIHDSFLTSERLQFDKII